MNHNKTNVFESASISIKWSGLIELLSRAVTPVIYVVLSRFLSPQDFGIFATAMIAISFSQIFWDAGLGKALIQSKEEPEKTANVAFWMSFLLGIFVYGMIFVSAPYVASFFHSPESLLVLRILGVQVIIDSISSVQLALNMKKLDFRKLFQVTFLATIIPGFISIPIAYVGYGVWALVAGAIAGSIIKCVVLWLKSTWCPLLRFDINISKKLASFGIWIIGESVLAWLLLWGDSFIVGKFMGMESLGIYRMGCIIATMVFGLLLNPILPVLYPTLCIINNDFDSLLHTFNKTNKIIISISLPLGIGLFFLSPYIETIIFGNKWAGLNTVIGIVGLTLGLTWMVGINTEVFRAKGRPDICVKLLLLTSLFYIPVFLASAPHGLEIFTLSRLGISAIIGVPLNILVFSRFLKINTFYLWQSGRKIFGSALLMSIVIIGYKLSSFTMYFTDHNLIDLFVIPILGTATYFSFLYLSDRHFITETMNIIYRAIKA